MRDGNCEFRSKSIPSSAGRGSIKADAVGGKAEKLLPLLGVYLLDSSLSLLMVSVAISGLSVLVLEHSGDPGEPDRRSMALGLAQSVEQFCVLGVEFFLDLPGSGLPVGRELESVEASVVWVPRTGYPSAVDESCHEPANGAFLQT